MKIITFICTITFLAVPSAGYAQDKSATASVSVMTRRGPVTPSAKLNAPYPPQKLGCHHLVNGAWQEVPCVAEEHLKDFPPPGATNGIQSTAHGISIFGRRGGITSPLTWGSVAINFGAPQGATETDNIKNAFSIQTNTNVFNCSTCSSGYPFAPVSVSGMIVKNSGSQAGDSGWVQFGYQNFQSSARLCVWNNDVTIAHNMNNAKIPMNANGGFATSGYYGYNSTCVSVPTTYPLTGPGASEDGGEVFGYITCPNANSNAGCTLTAVGYLPWGGSQGWWSVNAPDALELSGNWTAVSGGILGSQNGSTASFTKAAIQQVLRAYSCFVAPQGPTGYTPQPCAPPNSPWLGLLFDLKATPTVSYVTAESNNLMNDPVTFECEDYDCWLSYNSYSPDCTNPFCL